MKSMSSALRATDVFARSLKVGGSHVPGWNAESRRPQTPSGARLETPAQHVERAVGGLNHGAATLHPVAAIDIGDPADVPGACTVDVAADHAVKAAAARLLGQSGLEPAHDPAGYVGTPFGPSC